MKKLILILLLTFTFNSVFADSPLTSTEFYKAYLDIPLVNKISKYNGFLTDEGFDYLNSKSISIDKKIALINGLKWNIKGKNNAVLYFKKLLLTHKEYTPTNFYNEGTAEELICYAYLLAMDNYLDVKKAFLFSSQACKRNPNSYTFAIVNQLIKAQIDMGSDWCEVYSGMNKIRKNKKLVLDFRIIASNIIFTYINTYKNHCSVSNTIKKFIKES